MERFVIARTDKGGEGGTVTFAISDKTDRSRRRHLAAGGRREGRHPDAVRLPDGHLPNLRPAAGIGPRPRLPVGQRARRGRPNSDLHLRRIRRLHPQDLGGRHGHQRHQGIRPPDPRGRRGAGARTGRDQDRHRGIPRRDATPATSAGPSSCSADWPPAAESRCSPAGTRSRGRRAPRMLATAKIIENMELGHNITHGQWDWMNDPEIHSTEWEWDTTSPTRALEEVAQLHPPQVHQHRRPGRRHRLRHHASHPRPALGAVDDRQPDLQHPARHALRVGRRRCTGWRPRSGARARSRWPRCART